jgi:hypothetical protein
VCDARHDDVLGVRRGLRFRRGVLRGRGWLDATRSDRAWKTRFRRRRGSGEGRGRWGSRRGAGREWFRSCGSGDRPAAAPKSAIRLVRVSASWFSRSRTWKVCSRGCGGPPMKSMGFVQLKCGSRGEAGGQGAELARVTVGWALARVGDRCAGGCGRECMDDHLRAGVSDRGGGGSDWSNVSWLPRVRSRRRCRPALKRM